jgi:aspartyl-tRNA(Asn)/glutamyl-tRNA(Gln) amidotransferase subunit A
MDQDLPSISDLRRQFQSGERKPAEFVEELAAAIDARDPEIGSLLSHDLDAARTEARSADLSLPLGGVPVAIKDNMNVRGQPCTCGSRFLGNGYQAPYDATVVRKLREAGAIPFGRANLDEFAMGSSTENSALQRTINPAAPDRIPGGSSGGSAAAVAAGLAVAALGSDTGGSIRQPASHCGVVGLKPSYGRVSRYGLVAFASSLDQIGPLTGSVEDAALLLQAIAGHDPRDSTSLDVPMCRTILEGLDDGRRRHETRRAEANTSAKASTPPSAPVSRPASDKLAAAGAELVDDFAATHRICRRHLLHHRARRGLFEPVALRRHPLRPPHRTSPRTSSTSTAARARRASVRR